MTEQILKAFGVKTCGQLVEQRATLAALFSKVPSHPPMAMPKQCISRIITAATRDGRHWRLLLLFCRWQWTTLCGSGWDWDARATPM